MTQAAKWRQRGGAKHAKQIRWLQRRVMDGQLEHRLPRVGYLGMGAGREIVALHEGLLLRSVFQPIYRPSPLSPVAFEALI